MVSRMPVKREHAGGARQRSEQRPEERGGREERLEVESRAHRSPDDQPQQYRQAGEIVRLGVEARVIATVKASSASRMTARLPRSKASSLAGPCSGGIG